MQKFIEQAWSMLESVTRILLKLVLRSVGKNLSEKTFNTIMQFFKFGIVGVSNVIVSWGIYLVCLVVFEKANLFPRSDYLIAQIVGFFLSVLWSFYWNNRFVFGLNSGEERSFWTTLLKTYISYSFTGLFLNSILLLIWVQIFQISEYIAPIMNLFVSIPLNFIINKFWAFRKKE